MRELRRLLWAAAIAVISAVPAFAQPGGGGGVAGGTGGTLGGSLGGILGGTTGGLGGTTAGGLGGTGGTGSNSLAGQLGGSQQGTMQAAPSLVAPSKALNSSTNTAINASNFLRSYYGAVNYQGRAPAQVPNGLPGGFGAALYPITATGTPGGGAGGAGRAGAASSSVNTTDPGGILVPLPRQIAYSAHVQFKTAPAAPTVLQADLRGSLDRTPISLLANPAAVQVLVEGRTVILRGTVRDEEESHLVEGLVRLTPGVGAIQNELAFPK